MPCTKAGTPPYTKTNNELQYNLGSPTYMGPRYRWITGKRWNKLIKLYCTMQKFQNWLSFIYFTYINVYCEFLSINSIFKAFLQKKKKKLRNKSTAVWKVPYGNVQYWRTETLCTSKGLNKSVCQALPNTSQALLAVETCTRSRTPVWRLMPDYWTCGTSARPDYRDCTVYMISEEGVQILTLMMKMVMKSAEYRR
jgi:hypothetical protein